MIKLRARRAMLCAALALGAGLVCGSANAVTELTVIVYGGSFEAGWKKAVIEPFEAANPDIKVRIATGLTMNDPYAGGTHIPDIAVVMPVFHEGRVVALSASMRL